MIFYQISYLKFFKSNKKFDFDCLCGVNRKIRKSIKPNFVKQTSFQNNDNK